MSCVSILNNILAKQTELSSALATHKAALKAYRDAGCEGQIFASTDCKNKLAASNAANRAITRINEELSALNISFKRSGCEETDNCDNAGVNFFDCVTFPTISCSNHVSYKKQCCDLDTAVLFLTNLLAEAFDRQAKVDDCESTKKGLLKAAQDAYASWSNANPSDNKERAYTQWSTAFSSAADSLGYTVTTSGSGGFEKTMVADVPFDSKKIQELADKFFEFATSANVFSNILGFDLPGSDVTAGETDRLPNQIPECSGVTTIPALTFNCYSVAEKLAIQEAKENYLKEVVGSIDKNKFCANLVGGRTSSNKFELTKTNCGKQISAINVFAGRAFQSAIALYTSQAEAAETEARNAKLTVEQVEAMRNKKQAAKANLLNKIADDNFSFAIDLEHSIGSLVKKHIKESTIITYKVPCDSATVVERYPLASGLYGKQLYTETDGTFGITAFGDQVNKRFPPDKECCLAKTGKVVSGTEYSYPITLNASIKIVMSPDDIEAARGLTGIKELDKQSQDTLLNALNNCTKSLTWCIGETK